MHGDNELFLFFRQGISYIQNLYVLRLNPFKTRAGHIGDAICKYQKVRRGKLYIMGIYPSRRKYMVLGDKSTQREARFAHDQGTFRYTLAGSAGQRRGGDSQRLRTGCLSGEVWFVVLCGMKRDI